METIRIAVDADKRIYIEIPLVKKTFNDTDYKKLMREVFTAYANEALNLFKITFDPDVVYEICSKILKHFEQTFINLYNNYSLKSPEKESEFYRGVLTMREHLNDLASQRVSYLYSL